MYPVLRSGNACVGAEGAPLNPALEYFDHFATQPPIGSADAACWLITADNGGTSVIKDGAAGGVWIITPGTSANDFRSHQWNGESFALATRRKIQFEARIRTNDADDIKFFIGLASTDTTGTTAGPVLDGTNDSIGFRNVLGNTTAFLWITEDDTTENTGSAGTLADDTWTLLRFELEGTERCRFYVDGTLVGTSTQNLPDAGAALTLTVEIGSPTGTTATTLEIDWLWIYQDFTG